MMGHLTPEQIERYARRAGDVDEILAAAQHLEACPDCRDHAAALLDPGESPAISRRHRRNSGPRPALQSIARRDVKGWWLVVAALVLAAIVYLILRFT